MRFKKVPVALAALALASAPVAAQAAEDRTDSKVEGGENFGQAGILALFAILALVIGIASGGNGNNPVSR